MFILTLIFVQISTIIATSSFHIPDYLNLIKCDIDDKNYNNCKYDNIMKIIDYGLNNSIPELNLPKLEPFYLAHVKVNNNLNDLIKINADVKNIKLHGTRNTIIEKLKIDPKKLTGYMKMVSPKSTIEMEYDVKGQLFIIPLQSRGYFSGNYSDTVIEVGGSLTRYEKDGETYLKLQRMNVRYHVGDGYIKLISKRPDEQFAADLITNFFNGNPRFVLDALNPVFVPMLENIYKNMITPILEQMPAKDLLA